jgi:hypothetical protein
LLAACVVVRRRFTAQGRRGWGRYCLATAIVAPVLIILGMGHKDGVGVYMALGVAVMFGWVAALSAHLLAESIRGVAPKPE